jgi:16S rRNA (guanine527-N7)-methyltransferase
VADPQTAVYQLALRFGLAVSEAQWGSVAAFWSLLLKWNARINLTGARTREDLVGEHLPDALAMARLIPLGVRVVDIGAGGGLPGIPFALLRPDVSLTLVEPRAKRVAFLRTAVRESGLARAEVIADRVEALSARAWDVATSRATFAPEEWLEKGQRFAPAVLAFAARRADVGTPKSGALEADLSYETAAQHPRWTGLFRFT